MDYEREFYELMKKKNDEIKALDLPEERKLNLFFCISRDIQKYEQIKINFKISRALEKIVSMMAITLFNPKRISKNQEDNQNILMYKMPFPNYMPFSLN